MNSYKHEIIWGNSRIEKQHQLSNQELFSAEPQNFVKFDYENENLFHEIFEAYSSNDFNKLMRLLYDSKEIIKKEQIPSSISNKIPSILTEMLSNFEYPEVNEEESIESNIDPLLFLILRYIYLLTTPSNQFSSEFINSGILVELSRIINFNCLKIVRQVIKITYNLFFHSSLGFSESNIINLISKYLYQELQNIAPTDEQLKTEIIAIDFIKMHLQQQRKNHSKPFLSNDFIIDLLRSLTTTLTRSYPEPNFKCVTLDILFVFSMNPSTLPIFFSQNLLPVIYDATIHLPPIHRGYGFKIFAQALNYDELDYSGELEKEAVKNLASMIKLEDIIEEINTDGVLMLVNKWCVEKSIDDTVSLEPIFNLMEKVISEGDILKIKQDMAFCIMQILSMGSHQQIMPFLKSEFLSNVYEMIDTTDEIFKKISLRATRRVIEFLENQPPSTPNDNDQQCMMNIHDFLEEVDDSELAFVLLEKLEHYVKTHFHQ